MADAARNGNSAGFDYDWLVVGSGFGGSVAALRLAEKGHSVGVIECGRRYADDEFAEKTAQSRRYTWMPKLGMRGIFRMTVFKDVFIVSGSGVGGGSLGYANTLYRARDAFYEHPQWRGLAGDWGDELRPHYDTAERMLGVAEHPLRTPADDLLAEYAAEIGVADTHKRTRVGVCFGPEGTEPGEELGDPYFGGEGPDRNACLRCGSCMIGCRHGAKNTLVKNYLWFAEKLGVTVEAERMVTDVRPLGDGSGADGYEVTTERSGAWVRKGRRVLRARGVVLAAGALGTNKLLRECKHRGSLERVSDRLGDLVRTNSESIMAVTTPDEDFSETIAITSSIYPDPDTHIELVSYGKGGNSMSVLYTLMTGEGSKLTRPLLWLGEVVRHPLKFARTLFPLRWSERTIILLVMQTLDNAIRLVPKRRLLGRGVRLTTEQDPERPNPTFIPAADAAARWFAERTGGIAQSGLTEAILDIPTTAHILGGAVIGQTAADGVVDADHRVHGYENLLVTDGAAMPANPGVNPSLTITAMAERALSKIPAKGALAPLPEQARPAAVAAPAA